MERIYIFDTTLRDGGQTKGVDFSFADTFNIPNGKIRESEKLTPLESWLLYFFECCISL